MYKITAVNTDWMNMFSSPVITIAFSGEKRQVYLDDVEHSLNGAGVLTQLKHCRDNYGDDDENMEASAQLELLIMDLEQDMLDQIWAESEE